MSAVFRIHPGHPRPNVGVAGIAADLSEAIAMCFPIDAADAEFVLRDVSVPLNYKYDLSVIVEDIVDLLEHCLRQESAKVRLCSDTFNVSLSVRPKAESVALRADWHSVVGNKEKQLNEIPTVIVPARHFLEQWARLLEVAFQGLDRTGLVIRDTGLLDEARTVLRRVTELDAS